MIALEQQKPTHRRFQQPALQQRLARREGVSSGAPQRSKISQIQAGKNAEARSGGGRKPHVRKSDPEACAGRGSPVRSYRRYLEKKQSAEMIRRDFSRTVHGLVDYLGLNEKGYPAKFCSRLKLLPWKMAAPKSGAATSRESPWPCGAPKRMKTLRTSVGSGLPPSRRASARRGASRQHRLAPAILSPVILQTASPMEVAERHPLSECLTYPANLCLTIRPGNCWRKSRIHFLWIGIAWNSSTHRRVARTR
jgi:hypothetical protein